MGLRTLPPQRVPGSGIRDPGLGAEAYGSMAGTAADPLVVLVASPSGLATGVPGSRGPRGVKDPRRLGAACDRAHIARTGGTATAVTGRCKKLRGGGRPRVAEGGGRRHAPRPHGLSLTRACLGGWRVVPGQHGPRAGLREVSIAAPAQDGRAVDAPEDSFVISICSSRTAEPNVVSILSTTVHGTVGRGAKMPRPRTCVQASLASSASVRLERGGCSATEPPGPSAPPGRERPLFRIPIEPARQRQVRHRSRRAIRSATLRRPRRRWPEGRPRRGVPGDPKRTMLQGTAAEFRPWPMSWSSMPPVSKPGSRS